MAVQVALPVPDRDTGLYRYHTNVAYFKDLTVGGLGVGASPATEGRKNWKFWAQGGPKRHYFRQFGGLFWGPGMGGQVATHFLYVKIWLVGKLRRDFMI